MQKCYGSVKKLFRPRSESDSRDVEAAGTVGANLRGDAVFERTSLGRKPFQGIEGSTNKHSDGHEVKGYHTAAVKKSQLPSHHGLASLAIGSISSSHLLSDEENNRMNRKIDRLMAAIDDRRPIHFATGAETGEVEIFADYDDEVNDQSDYGLEEDVAAVPENFGRVLSHGGGIHRIRSRLSLRHASSNESLASMASRRSSSNAWERAIAAANVRFALENGDLGLEAAVVGEPFRCSDMADVSRRRRRLVRTISPIPLDFNKRDGVLTPSVHSNGSELDTSSPLFAKSCERILRETYAEPPESSFQRGVRELSQPDERAFVRGPHDVYLSKARGAKSSSETRKAFGVFKDTTKDKSSSKLVEKPAIRSKVLKDTSNLRRSRNLLSNSFANDVDSSKAQKRTAVPAKVSPVGFGGAPDAKSRRTYINSKWPGLLKHRETRGAGSSRTAEQGQLDGVARRRNEQVVGRPLDTSLYSLSHVRTSVADSSLNVNPARQAHFDLALARLEGRALPPLLSPIRRYPDLAALFDQDIQMEGSHRPLPLRGPVPSRPANPTPRRAFWRGVV